MNEIIDQLINVKEHLKWIKTEYISVDFDISVLETCITQLEHINNKSSEDEIVGKLEKLENALDKACADLEWFEHMRALEYCTSFNCKECGECKNKEQWKAWCLDD